MEYVDINGNKALVSEEDNYIVITWKEDEYFFELSKDDFEKYKNVIPQADMAYWLKEAGEKSNEILCVQPDGNIKGEDVSNSEIALRQACWLDINKSVETAPTATPAG